MVLTQKVRFIRYIRDDKVFVYFGRSVGWLQQLVIFLSSSIFTLCDSDNRFIIRVFSEGY